MTPEQAEKRKRIMKRSIALGHCVCDPRKPCPCPVFKEKNICECAGEKLPVTSGAIKLTEHVRAAGCASKIGKKDLQEVLSGLPDINDERVLVGRSAGDDAGVIKLPGQDASILTVDVFSPSVDDPYEFGQIAAANSISDIYAMGGVAQAALSIIGFPVHLLDNSVMREILRGGIDKMAEAGISVIGGHSINDEEIKFGFAVLGSGAEFVTNSGAQIGDVMVLTKPLGTGITSFAGQIGKASEDELKEISTSMAALNKAAGELMVKHNATAATDITGFSLLGHLVEIVKNSRVKVELYFDSIPFFSAIKRLAGEDAFPGAVEKNREAVPSEMLEFGKLTEGEQNILFGPETSGGLLVFMSESNAGKYIAELKDHDVEAVCIGKVVAEDTAGLIEIKGGGNIKASPSDTPVLDEVSGSGSACCSAGTDSDSSCCSAGGGSTTSSTLVPSSTSAEFKRYMSVVNAAGAIESKNKKLISLALSVSHKCGTCIKLNTAAALTAGASEEEISEAVALGVAFGGASASMFYNELMQA